VSYYWCKDCGGEMVSCECPEIVDDYDGPELADDYEEIDDRAVVWVVGDNGVGRVEVQQ
jgi:hypothetical protein